MYSKLYGLGLGCKIDNKEAKLAIASAFSPIFTLDINGKWPWVEEAIHAEDYKGTPLQIQGLLADFFKNATNKSNGLSEKEKSILYEALISEVPRALDRSFLNLDVAKYKGLETARTVKALAFLIPYLYPSSPLSTLDELTYWIETSLKCQWEHDENALQAMMPFFSALADKTYQDKDDLLNSSLGNDRHREKVWEISKRLAESYKGKKANPDILALGAVRYALMHLYPKASAEKLISTLPEMECEPWNKPNDLTSQITSHWRKSGCMTLSSYTQHELPFVGLGFLGQAIKAQDENSIREFLIWLANAISDTHMTLYKRVNTGEVEISTVYGGKRALSNISSLCDFTLSLTFQAINQLRLVFPPFSTKGFSQYGPSFEFDTNIMYHIAVIVQRFLSKYQTNLRRKKDECEECAALWEAAKFVEEKTGISTLEQELSLDTMISACHGTCEWLVENCHDILLH